MIPIGPWADFSGSSLYYEGGDHRSRQGGGKVLYASVENAGTKVYLDEDFKVLWNAGDRISVFYFDTCTTLEFCCHGIMFQGCSNLNYIEISATDISATECIYGWVAGVAPTGTIVMDSQATWDPYSNGLPSGWSISYL